jgi:hypothetical protein
VTDSGNAKDVAPMALLAKNFDGARFGDIDCELLEQSLNDVK